MVKFLKVRVMKTIAPSSHPHVRSPRRRPPAGFRSARARAPSRLFFVAASAAARGRAAPADDGRGADDEARLGDRASPASPRGFTGRPRFRDDAERTPVAVARAVAREMPRARPSPSRATTAARDGGSGAGTRAREAAFPPDRGRAVVPRARGARGPAPALAARTPRARRLGFFQLLRCRIAVKMMTGAGGAARFAAIDPLSSRASR